MTESVSKPTLIELNNVDFAWHAQANLTIKSANLCVEEHDHVFIRVLLDLVSRRCLILSGVLLRPSKEGWKL